MGACRSTILVLGLDSPAQVDDGVREAGTEEMPEPPSASDSATWRSVRVHSETKTERSRRTLGLAAAAVQALRSWTDSQADERLAAGEGWQDTGLVFTT